MKSKQGDERLKMKVARWIRSKIKGRPDNRATRSSERGSLNHSGKPIEQSYWDNFLYSFEYN